MRGNEFLDKMALIDPAYIEEAEVSPKRKRLEPLKKILIAAACLVLILSVGFGGYAYAAEAIEYNNAIRFFDEYELSTEGLSRAEIKNVYRDIENKSFSYSGTVYVITRNISPELLAGCVIPTENSTPEEIEAFWNYRISVAPEKPVDPPPETPVETPVGTPAETEDPPRRRCPGMHKYEEGIIDEGSCTEERTMGNICVNCGWSYVTKKLGKVHTFGEYVITVPKTCKSDGLEVSECTLCGEKDERVIPAAHTRDGDNYYLMVKSTCVEHGFIDYDCIVCGEYARDELPLVEHIWIVTVKPATCDLYGEKTGICSVCGKNKTFERYDTLGHSYIAAADDLRFCTRCYNYKDDKNTYHLHFMINDIKKKATCTSEGALYAYCANGDCTLTFNYVIPAKGHTYSEEEYVEATCTEDGFSRKTCFDCGYVDWTEYPKTDHNFECVGGTKYICTECGVEKS